MSAYKLVTVTGNARPSFVPMTWTGYNKTIGTGGEFATFAAASVAAGDSILVLGDLSVSAQVLISPDDVLVNFGFGSRLLSTLTSGSIFKVTGARFRSPNLRVRADAALTAGNVLVELAGDDFSVGAAYLETNHASIAITNAVLLSGARGEMSGSVVATLGAFTNLYSDTGTNNDKRLRGA